MVTISWFLGNLKLIPDDVTGEENRQPSNNVQQENFLMVSKVGFELVQRQKESKISVESSIWKFMFQGNNRVR